MRDSAKLYRVICLILVLVTILGNTSIISANPTLVWEKKICSENAEEAKDFLVTTEGSYIITGYRYQPDKDIYIVKIDSNGTVEWENTIGEEETDVGNSVIQTRDGGYIIAGYTWASARDVYLVKTDSYGFVEWESIIDIRVRDEAHSIYELEKGYMVVGTTEHPEEGYRDFLLLRVDDRGDIQWTKTFGFAGLDQCMSSTATSDGGFLLVGYSQPYGSDVGDVYLVKVDSSGELLWEKTYGGEKTDRGHHVCETSDGGYIVAGLTQSFNAKHNDVYLVKTDSEGNIEWQSTILAKYYNEANYITELDNGDFLFTGSTSRGSFTDLLVTRVNSTGSQIWNLTAGGTNHEVGIGIHVKDNGQFIICGYSKTNGEDVYLIHVSDVLTEQVLESEDIETGPNEEDIEQDESEDHSEIEESNIPSFSFTSICLGLYLVFLIGRQSRFH